MDLDGVKHCLNVIGFNNANERNRIMDDGLAEFVNFKQVTERDISDMAEAFSKRTVADGRIIFGHGRTKGLKGLMHWVQDQYRCNDLIVFIDFTVNEMNLALERAHSRKQEK